MKIISIVFGMMVFISTVCNARSYQFEVNVGSSVAEGIVTIGWESEDMMSPSVGVRGIVSNDSYSIYSCDLALGNALSILGRECKFRMGFTPFFGTVENEDKDDQEADIGGVGFMLSSIINFPEFPLLPVEISGDICYAPSPLCFNDTDDYFEIKTSVGFHILKRFTGEPIGTIMLGLKYIGAGIDESWDMSESSILIGYRFTF